MDKRIIFGLVAAIVLGSILTFVGALLKLQQAEPKVITNSLMGAAVVLNLFPAGILVGYAIGINKKKQHGNAMGA